MLDLKMMCDVLPGTTVFVYKYIIFIQRYIISYKHEEVEFYLRAWLMTQVSRI